MLPVLLLAACTTSVKDIPEQSNTPEINPLAEKIFYEKQMRKWSVADNSVLLLLPLSGEHEIIGRSALNACLLASKDIPNIDFYVVDTTTADTLSLHEKFKDKKFTAIVGPVFCNEIVKYATIFGETSFFSLSNNIDINNQRTIACGLSPQEELNAICKYLKKEKRNGLLLMMPQSEYANKIIVMARKAMISAGFDPEDDMETLKYKTITRENATQAIASSSKKAIFVIDPILDIEQLNNHEIFTLSSSALSNKSEWNGTFFAFGDSGYRQVFIEKYNNMFHKAPTAIDMVAYDTVQAICKSCLGNTDIFDEKFPGCFGDFTFDKKNGIMRKLQIYKISDGKESPLNS